MKRLGEIQTILMGKLEKEGKIKDLGKSYRALSKSPRKVTNATIMSFVSYAETLGYKLTKGVRGGLETAVLSK